MKGDAQIIETLNELLTKELTAVNQYYINYKMCEDWGLGRLAAYHKKESFEEMVHADQVIARILFLEGVPNMQRYDHVKVGETPIEQLRLVADVERAAVQRYGEAIALAVSKNDFGTRDLLEKILVEEEEGLDHIESQMDLIERVGEQHYLAQQIHPEG